MKATRLNIAAVLGLIGLAVLLITPAMAPVQAQQGSLTGARVYAPPGSWLSINAAALGVNAIALPANGSTQLSNIVDTRGVKALAVESICTQVYNLDATAYLEDGTTQAGTAALANGLGTSGYTLTTVVIPTATTTSLVLPQRALAFSFANTTATAGTCTARVFVQY